MVGKSTGMSKFRAAWARIDRLNLALYAYHKADLEEAGNNPDFEEDEEIDPDDATVYLSIEGYRGKVSINLSSLTYTELIYLSQFLNHAISVATPAVKARDRKARDAYTTGREHHPRVYRGLPEFIVRRRLQHQYTEGIPLGLDDVLDGRLSAEHFPPGTGAARLGISSKDPSRVRSQDLGAQADGNP